MIRLPILAVVFALPWGVADAQESAGRGEAFVVANCARCHAVGPSGDSPLALAPQFRDLHLRYPVEFIEEALAEGIVTGHADMPQFELQPDEIAAVIAYLKSLE